MKPLLLACILTLPAWADLAGQPPVPATNHPALQPPSAPAAPRKQKEEPLLLPDDLGEFGTKTADLADNSRCQVCHLNLIREDLALDHAKAGIGCAKCHGESDAHIADESWASGGNGTAPDIMFPPAKINPACLQCHPRAKINSSSHREFFDGTSQEKYCTTCHGKHRAVNRKCKWK